VVRHSEQVTLGEERRGLFRSNISESAEEYLNQIKADNNALFFSRAGDSSLRNLTGVTIFSGLKSNWPRIPLPAAPSELLASAELGRQVAAPARSGDACGRRDGREGAARTAGGRRRHAGVAASN